MDKEFEKQNKEAIKNAMMMQERTLQHQVRELHRLYHKQLELMDEANSQPDVPQGHESSNSPVPTEVGESSSSQITQPLLAAMENQPASSSIIVDLDKLNVDGDNTEEENNIELQLGGVESERREETKSE